MSFTVVMSGYASQTVDSTGSANYGFYGAPFANFPQQTIVTPYQGPLGVKRVSKELRITPSLKGFQVFFTDSHGNTKSSEYSEKELTEALPDLLGKLKKEPKEE